MALTRTVPGPKGDELRSFECAKCERALTVSIARDPMRSDKMGWIAGELKPPE
jgi:hypothetical protein